MREAAFTYAKRGWPVFPCKPGEKRPATRNGFKDAVKDVKRIRDWWRRRPDYNIGIATGEVSGLVVLDVDPRSDGNDTLAKLEADHGKLPATVTAQTGGGGHHLLFKHPGGKVKCRAHALGRGLDVKADGGHIVAPPSLHTSGKRYTWADGLDPDSIEVAELPEWLATALVQKPEEPAAYGCVSCVSEGLSIWESMSLCQYIELAIDATKPMDPGHRETCVFKFARWLKAHPKLASASLTELRPYIDLWHEAAADHASGEHDADSTRAEFAHAWPRVRFPMGEGPLFGIMAIADKAEPPKCAKAYGALAGRLIRLCRELQRRADDRPFFLDYRNAGVLLGIDRNKAGKLLGLLCAEGVLERVSKGHTGRATEYRYIGGD